MEELTEFPVVLNLGLLSDDLAYRLHLTDGLGSRPSVSLTVVQINGLADLGLTSDLEVLLLDIENWIGVDIQSVLENISAGLPGTKIMLVGDTLNDEILAHSIKHHVCGILPKASPCEIYLKAILAVSSGEIWLERRTLTSLLNYMIDRNMRRQTSFSSDIVKTLTEREQEIVGLAANGLSNKEIARMVALSPVTVKTHLRNIFQKLHITSRVELILQRSKT